LIRHSDFAIPQFLRDGGQDWFFANLVFDAADDATKKDKITDLHVSEFVADLDFILAE
jgi:hypothetical protein